MSHALESLIMPHLRRTTLHILAAAAVVIGFTQWAQASDKSTFRWVDDAKNGTTDLMLGKQPVLRYMHAFDPSSKDRAHETYKVYHHVFGPGDGKQITKGPGGKYTHHRGLFVGWNKTKTKADGAMYDFWHCSKGAHLRHIKFVDRSADANGGKMTAEIHWNAADGKPVISEIRSVAVSKTETKSGPGFGWQIDWQTTLSSRRGEIELNGDRQHAGFQFRAAQAVADANGARYIRPKGFPQQAEAFQVGDKGDPPAHINLGWLAMTYEIDGTRYTAEYFADPSLPKPSLYSERPYGRFGVFFKTTLSEGKPLTMRYRVNISSGEPPTQKAIQGRYDAFVAELKAAKQK